MNWSARVRSRQTHSVVSLMEFVFLRRSSPRVRFRSEARACGPSAAQAWLLQGGLPGKGPSSRNMNTGPRRAAHPTISAKIGVAPVRATALAVAANVNEIGRAHV